MTTPSVVEEAINRLQQEIWGRQALITLLEEHRTALEALGVRISTVCGRIDLDHLTHTQVVEAIKAIGGRWEKDVSRYFEKTTLDYSHESGKITLCGGEPPPNCKIVEEVVEIPATPARKETRKVLVCK